MKRLYNACSEMDVGLLTRGDARWGMGHLYRVSWLAAALTAQYHLDLSPVVHCLDTPEARGFWGRRSFPIEFHGERLLLEGPPGPPSLIAVDWLDSHPALIRRLAAFGARIALLDDYGPAQANAHLVVNALLAPLRSEDDSTAGTRTLSGPAYIQLPPAATKLRGTAQATAAAMATELAGPPPQVGPVRGIVVSFGGAANESLVEKTLQALREAQFGGRVTVMPAPPAPPHAGELDVEYLPAGEEFHALLSAADLAVCGCGLTLYEAAFLGVPAVAIAVLSGSPAHPEHQLSTGRKLEAAGTCLLAGPAPEVDAGNLALMLSELLRDPEQRGRMSAAGMRLIDGHGLMRTVEAILDLSRR